MISTQPPEVLVPTFDLVKQIEIAASIEIVFESLLEELGPEGLMPVMGPEGLKPESKPFPMVLEAWPGGRWYRDLGNNAGHFWGHVQVIKPPTLLEIFGPLAMSFPAMNHMQYRLTAQGDITRLVLTHRALGMIQEDFRQGAGTVWGYRLDRTRILAERRRDQRSK